MSTTYPCDTCGSASATSDYCDMCGAAMRATAPAPGAAADPEADAGVDPAAGPRPDPTPVPPSEPTGSDDTCYFCGGPRSADDPFCEVCGLDFVSGQMPAPPTPPPIPTPVASAPPAGSTTVMAAPPSGWTAVVGADRIYFDGNVTAGVVTFPDALGPRHLPLAGDEVTIGRRSQSQGYHPDIDLSSPVDDPAVSRRHAVLQRQADGSWAVMDVGSTNGTWLNDEDQPLGHGVLRALHDGDRLLLGAFTSITIRHGGP